MKKLLSIIGISISIFSIYCFGFKTNAAMPTLSRPQEQASKYEEYPLESYLTVYSLTYYNDYGYESPKLDNKTLDCTFFNYTSTSLSYTHTMSYLEGSVTSINIGADSDVFSTMIGYTYTTQVTNTESIEVIVLPGKTLRCYSYDGIVRELTYARIKYKRTRSWPWVAFGNYTKIDSLFNLKLTLYHGSHKSYEDA